MGGVAEDFFFLKRNFGFLDPANKFDGSESVASDITHSYISFLSSAGRSKKDIPGRLGGGKALCSALDVVPIEMVAKTVALLPVRELAGETSTAESLRERSFLSILSTERWDLGCQVVVSWLIYFTYSREWDRGDGSSMSSSSGLTRDDAKN